MTQRRTPTLEGRWLLLVAALSAMTAGGIHLAVVREHWDVSLPMTVFFVTVGVGQLLFGAALRWVPPPWLLTAAVAAHLVIIGLYVASRTRDLPFVPLDDPHGLREQLPAPGAVGDGVPVYPGSRIEPVGALDMICLVLELVLVVALTLLLPPRWRTAVTTLLAAAAGLAVLARVTGQIA